ncbi:MAG: RraA family protein [Burkholderiaceae bacterium]|nr:RraA family protein [Burkholderiaceae bacterium]
MLSKTFDVGAFRTIPTACLSDNLDRLVGIGGLRRFDRGGAFAARAHTVKTRPGDNLAIYKALFSLQSGYLLVVDGEGATENALIGDILVGIARSRGCAGFIIDGAIRDSDAIARLEWPCFAKAVTHRGPYKDGPGTVGEAVSICGQIVNQDDIIVGDADGLVAFPGKDAERLLTAAKAKVALEDELRDACARDNGQAFLERELSKKGWL